MSGNRRGSEEHLWHPGASSWTFIADDDNIARLDPVTEDCLEGPGFAVEDTGPPAMLQHPFNHSACLDDAAIWGEVSAEHGDPALGVVRVSDRSNNIPIPPRPGDRGGSCGSGNSVRLSVNQTFSQKLAHYRGDSSRFVEILEMVWAGRTKLDKRRRVSTDLVESVERAGFEVRFVRFFNYLLFVPIAAVRVAEEYLAAQDYESSASEVLVPISEALDRPDCWGTADHIGRRGDALEVADYKHGSGVMVDADCNYQMILYALGAMMVPEFSACTSIKMTIIQPRIDHEDGPIRSCTMSVDELGEWRDWFKRQAALTDDPNAPRIPGGKQCQWCRARGTCPELAQHSMGRSLAVFDEVTLEVQPDSLLGSPAALTGDQVKTILDNEKLISSWLKSVKEHAMSGALAGNPPPEYKLVAGRKSKSLALSAEDTET